MGLLELTILYSIYVLYIGIFSIFINFIRIVFQFFFYAQIHIRQ